MAVPRGFEGSDRVDVGQRVVTAGVYAQTLVVHHHDGEPTVLDGGVWYWLNRDPDGTKVVLVDEAGAMVDELRNVLHVTTN